MADLLDDPVLTLARSLLHELRAVLSPRKEVAARLDGALRHLEGACPTSVPEPISKPAGTRSSPVDEPAAKTAPAPSPIDLESYVAQRAIVEEGGRMYLPTHLTPAPPPQPRKPGPETAWQSVQCIRTAYLAAQNFGLTQEQVAAMVHSPDMKRPGPRHAKYRSTATYYFRGGHAALVSDRDGAILAIRTADDAMSQIQAPGVRTPGQRTARGGAGRSWPTSAKELKARLREHGFTVQTGKTHPRIVHQDHPGRHVTFSSTPSDNWRALKNLGRQIRATFGVDLRDMPST
ncbi:MAG: hypothetical protein Q4P36_02730 [Bowdeniella nasicola]|nr:hypothetical protein [Bowdeniella nasicola]